MRVATNQGLGQGMHTPGPNFIGSQVQLLQRSTHVMHTACDSDGTWVAKPVFGKVQRPQRSQDDQRVCQERRHFGCEQVAAEVEVLQSIPAPRVASSSAQPFQNEHRARVRQKVACQHQRTKLWTTRKTSWSCEHRSRPRASVQWAVRTLRSLGRAISARARAPSTNT